MSLGMELGLGPGNFVLDGDPALPSPKGGAEPQIFGPCLLWPNGCMHVKMPLDMEVGLSPEDLFDGDPAPLPKKGMERPNFRPMSIAVKRLHGSRCHLVRR